MKQPSVETKIRQIFYKNPNGWKLCSTRADKFTDKFKTIVLDKLGNHPLGDYEYIDDCACMLNWGLDTDGCGCECHKEVNYYTKEILSLFPTQQAQMREKVLEYKRRNILRMNSSEIALIDDVLTTLEEE